MKDTQNNKIYLPPKGGSWSSPASLFDNDSLITYKNPWGNMDILNLKEIDEVIYHTPEKTFTYRHFDGQFPHSESIYLSPGSPNNRSDSLTRI